MLSSIVYGQEFKIPKSSIHNEIEFNKESVTKNEKRAIPMKPKALQAKEEIKFEQKSYGDIKYNHDNDWYSIINHDPEEYDKFISFIGMPSSAVNKMLGTVSTPNAIMLNAFYNDYLKENPSVAENYYILFDSNKKINFYERRLRYADYLIRTDRPEKVLEILSHGECIANGRLMSMCNYYIGVAKYLTTGARNSYELRQSKDAIPKAKEIYLP